MKLGDLPGVSPASRLRGLCNAATVAVPRQVAVGLSRRFRKAGGSGESLFTKAKEWME